MYTYDNLSSRVITDDERDELCKLHFQELCLSVRCQKVAKKLGVKTIGDLIRHTAEDFLECKNFGVTSLNELREKLEERGLRLRGD